VDVVDGMDVVLMQPSERIGDVVDGVDVIPDAKARM